MYRSFNVSPVCALSYVRSFNVSPVCALFFTGQRFKDALRACFLNHIRSHRGYCTLCDAYVFWPGGVKSRLEIQHLNRRQRRLFSLVPMLAAGAVFGLLDVVGGEHAEDHRFARDQVCLGDAVGYGLADIIEVRCLALDHTSEANDGVDISLARHEQSPE